MIEIREVDVDELTQIPDSQLVSCSTPYKRGAAFTLKDLQVVAVLRVKGNEIFLECHYLNFKESEESDGAEIQALCGRCLHDSLLKPCLLRPILEDDVKKMTIKDNPAFC